MKIYLAGKWSDKKENKDKMNLLIDDGHTITHDWTNNEITTRNHEELQKYAILDINGVMNADVLIAVMDDPEYAYRGTFTEIGAALGNNKPVIIISKCLNEMDIHHYASTNCFYHHSLIKYVSCFENVFELLKIL
jgi:nucleoside 2-deoxyribosyltransferase